MRKIKLVESGRKEIEAAFNDFIRSCKIKNLSEKTLEFYQNYIKQFKRFLYGEEVTFADQINEDVINVFTLWLKESCIYKDVSINTSLRAVRAIVYYFQRVGYCSPFKIRLIKADKQFKEPYTLQELKVLLVKPRTKVFSEYRNWVVINFLLSTGVRVGELVNIKVKDINLDESMVRIKRGKSRRERHIPLSKTTQKVLAEYLRARQYQNEEQYIFCNTYGGKWSEESCKHSIANYNKTRGIRKTSIHLFRHTMAKMFILNGGDLFRLQKILGHKSLEMVKEYVAMFTDDLKQDFDNFNPLEQFMSRGERIKIY